MEVLTEAEATYRVINLNRCEVWCPLHEKDVCVYAKCLAGESRDACEFYEGLHSMGRVLCTWPEDARRDRLDSPTSPLV